MTPGNPHLRTLWWLAAAALLLALLYGLAPVLMPFFLAAILGYICQPLVAWLGRRRLPRTASVLLVMLLEFVLLALAALLVVPLAVKEISLLVQQFPGFLDWLNRTVAPKLAEYAGISASFDAESLKAALNRALQDSEGLGMKLLDSVRLGGLGVIGLFANLVLVPVVQFFLMRDWELILERAGRLVPRRWFPQVTQFAKEADEALGQYLHGQVLVILVMSLFYTLGLWLTGLSFFLPIGVITGVLVFVPYVGAATGFLLASLAALMQFQDWNGLVWVWIVFLAGQVIEGNLVTPKLVGERIGLHPIAVIFALLAFGQLFGLLGLLLALPASAVLLVALRKLRAAYVASRLYGEEP
ncbi:MAG: AI-2E family transporter [Betaproteobacteria bacterium]|nr:AI-2E family transporter [Betaproteobacteria bacterium]MBI2962079.1 AI-2E family transporter [Betaproteobacteria bacterium]